MGYCELVCPDDESECCIYCDKQDSCDVRCTNTDSFGHTGECGYYIRGEEKQ